MVATNFFAGAAVLLAAARQVSAGSAIITNQCPFKVYLWSISDVDSSMQTIEANGGQYSESYQTNPNGGGISIKMGADTARQSITQFEYTLTGSSLWYDLSNINGFPFEQYGVTVVPSDSGCRSVSCPAGQSLCGQAYNVPSDNFATAECGSSANTVVVLCSNETDTSGSSSSISSVASAAVSTASPVSVFSSVAATSTQAAQTSSSVVSTTAPAHKHHSSTTEAPATTAAPATTEAAVNDNPYVVVQTTFVTHIVTVEARSPQPTAAKRDVHHEHAAVHHEHAARRHSHPRAFPKK